MNIRARMNDVLSQVAAAGALIVVVIALSIASPYFLTTNNLFNVCVQIAVIAIIAVGQTMVIITAGIDLSVGSVARSTACSSRRPSCRRSSPRWA